MEHPWPSEEEIALRPTSFSDAARRWSCFDFSGCRHPNAIMSHMGPWQVAVCDDCGHAQIECTHPEMEWNDAGTLLRCTTCGIDGT